MTLRAVCDGCDIVSPEPVSYTRFGSSSLENWPNPQGCSIQITMNGKSDTKKSLMFCPACTRKKGLLELGDNLCEYDDGIQKQFLDAMVEVVLERGHDEICDIARSSMED